MIGETPVIEIKPVI